MTERTSQAKAQMEEAMWWAVERWNDEVKHRPRTNIYRPILDGTWRQVIKHFGGDPDKLLGCEVQIVVEKQHD